MKIQFEWEEFLEDDDRFHMLFVKVGDGDWHAAMPNYDTEDEDEIVTILKIYRVMDLFIIGSISAIVLTAILLYLNYGN